jgi:hypothetical protein
MAERHKGLTWMLLELNHLLDTGKYDAISVDEVKKHIHAGTVLDFLQERAAEDVDLSSYTTTVYGNFKEFYGSYLRNIIYAYGGNERRKWGVENRGLCLLIAWTTEILAHGSGWAPRPDMAGVEY